MAEENSPPRVTPNAFWDWLVAIAQALRRSVATHCQSSGRRRPKYMYQGLTAIASALRHIYELPRVESDHPHSRTLIAHESQVLENMGIMSIADRIQGQNTRTGCWSRASLSAPARNLKWIQHAKHRNSTFFADPAQIAGYRVPISIMFIRSKEDFIPLEILHGWQCMVLPRAQYPCDANCRKNACLAGKQRT